MDFKVFFPRQALPDVAYSLAWIAEHALLEQHKGKVGIRDLHHALNALAGRDVYVQTVYRLLRRHGWKAKMPCPVHPDQAVGVQDAFKKNP